MNIHKLAMTAFLALTSSLVQGATFVMEKYGTGYSIDGNGGAQVGQQLYLWGTNLNNVNQQWVQLDRGNGYYSYKKQGTNLCWDAGSGGSRRQAVTLQTCNASNYNQHFAKVKVYSGTEIYRFEKRNASGFSLDGNNGAAKRQSIYLWDSNSNNVNQQWELFRVDGGGSSGGAAIPSYITNGSIFDLEGSNPHPLVNSSTLKFVPLEARYTSPNGNGWRHEYKVKSSLRVAMTESYEVFDADVKVDMSKAGKTIVAQHHASDTGTIMKVYVSDSSESGFDDSVAGNGIFDVYVRLRNTSGNEEKYALGTIRSGDTFDLKVVNDYGHVTVYSMGRAFGIQVEDDSESYFKFGNYLQSQNTYTNTNCGESGNSGSFADCFEDLGITEATVTMTNVSYIRVTD